MGQMCRLADARGMSVLGATPVGKGLEVPHPRCPCVGQSEQGGGVVGRSRGRT